MSLKHTELSSMMIISVKTNQMRISSPTLLSTVASLTSLSLSLEPQSSLMTLEKMSVVSITVSISLYPQNHTLSICLLTPLPVVRVGYEFTEYRTPEGDLVVELCAIIYEPTLEGPSPRAFTLSFVTSDGTASKFADLSGVSNSYNIF